MAGAAETGPFRPPALRPLPLGRIRPAGWLAGQLRIQADGLTGHLDEFWPDVADSGWIGGGADGWERGPYWLDGLVPLAFLLDDQRLLGKARRWVEHILGARHADGWLGPDRPRRGGKATDRRDPWPVFVAMKALAQYQEATGDGRVLDALLAACRCIADLLDRQPLFEWNRMRWPELAWLAQWLHDRTGDAALPALVDKAAGQGYDWIAHFADFRYRDRSDRWSHETHVVNNAMGLKAAALLWRRTGRNDHRRGVADALAALDRCHGQATGVFTGDECLAGTNPSQGTELCAVVEMMFSLEVAAGITGEPALADRLERVAFNALPAAFRPDMWAHQYDQQANQVLCRRDDDAPWTTNGPDANLFGLEPHYGCCLANMHQGWPKLASHLWMAAPDGGLAAVAWAPCSLRHDTPAGPVELECRTEYPFGETVELTVRASRPTAMPLHLRIPAWADGATVTVADAPPADAPAGGFFRLDRTWSGESVVRLHFPAAWRVQRRHHGAVTLHRGPLVYALRVGERWEQVAGRRPHADWEVLPTTPWNVGLRLDPADLGEAVRLQRRGVGDRPFSPEGAPLVATVPGRRVPGWTLAHNAAAPPPAGPVEGAGEVEQFPLIPYGCTNLRVTELPLLRQ